MGSDATVPQLAAVSGVSVLFLLLGLVAPANWVNLTLSAREVGGAIMPPGMVMDRDTPAEAMLDTAAVDPRDVEQSFDLSARGDRELASRMVGGVRTFELETSVIRWSILPDAPLTAMPSTARSRARACGCARVSRCASSCITACRKAPPSTGTGSCCPTRWTAGAHHAGADRTRRKLHL